jgi:hypothetical protein
MQSKGWEPALLQKYNNMMIQGPLQAIETTVSSVLSALRMPYPPKHPVGLTLHVIDVYLRELLNVEPVRCPVGIFSAV